MVSFFAMNVLFCCSPPFPPFFDPSKATLKTDLTKAEAIIGELEGLLAVVAQSLKEKQTNGMHEY
jgi:hypothetical protein